MIEFPHTLRATLAALLASEKKTPNHDPTRCAAAAGKARLQLARTPLPVLGANTPRALDEIDARLRGVLEDLIEGRRPWPFYLYGGVGRGKTAAVLWLCDHVYGSIYRPFRRLLQEAEWARRDGAISVDNWDVFSRDGADGTATWHSRKKTDSLSDKAFWLWLRSAPLLALDDVGTRNAYSDAQYDHLLDLLDSRLGRPTIVVSNLDLAGIAKTFDDRIASRLGAGTVASLGGVDRRAGGGRLERPASEPSANGAKV